MCFSPKIESQLLWYQNHVMTASRGATDPPPLVRRRSLSHWACDLTLNRWTTLVPTRRTIFTPLAFRVAFSVKGDCYNSIQFNVICWGCLRRSCLSWFIITECLPCWRSWFVHNRLAGWCYLLSQKTQTPAFLWLKVVLSMPVDRGWWHVWHVAIAI